MPEKRGHMAFQASRCHGKRPPTCFVFCALFAALGLNCNEREIVRFIALEYKYTTLSLSRMGTAPAKVHYTVSKNIVSTSL